MAKGDSNSDLSFLVQFTGQIESGAHLLTHSLTYSPTHSLTHSPR